MPTVLQRSMTESQASWRAHGCLGLNPKPYIGPGSGPGSQELVHGGDGSLGAELHQVAAAVALRRLRRHLPASASPLADEWGTATHTCVGAAIKVH